MLGADGKPRAELFASDGLHLNETGYELWTKIVKPLLIKADVSRKQQLARGVVFHDANNNRKFDQGEKRLPSVRISNGQDIVTTNEQGRYQIPVSDDTILFVVKPRNWRTPIGKEKLPEFYYIHKPNGSPDLKFAGVKPTGDLPESVDFPLYPQKEPDKFHAILFGDTQPRDQKEIDWIAHDTVEELVGTEASFGVTLGDIVFDDLNLFKSMSRTVALLGIPWYNVIGNHDINYDAKDDLESDETFESVFGPAYYSFDHGPVHFLVLDNIEWIVQELNGRNRGRYRGGLGERQMEFIRNDLALVPEEQLVVLLMHIPLAGVRDKHELYRLIENRKFCMSISGHTHHHEHVFIKKEDGWQGAVPHHHVINVTVCGSWWSGAPDERGIPHTTMADGAPNGYSIISFDGQNYTLDFKASSRPADYQMNIMAPEEISIDAAADAEVYVNVFNGSERSEVKLRLGNDGEWTTMQRTVTIDPLFKKIAEAEKAIKEKK
ncbi:MAG: calcineurin-like phosphoesterase C-terminal domain-containing protein [Planctomycetes bacterium]|nr:calcineurin-like phosphoesterase C-terminal domain-containing protein [Planctomycetota bacterium]